MAFDEFERFIFAYIPSRRVYNFIVYIVFMTNNVYINLRFNDSPRRLYNIIIIIIILVVKRYLIKGLITRSDTYRGTLCMYIEGVFYGNLKNSQTVLFHAIILNIVFFE